MTTTELTLAEVAELVVRHGAQGYMSGGKSRIEFTDDQLMGFAADLVQRGREAAAHDILDHPGPDPSPADPAWWAGYAEAKKDSARIAGGPQVVAAVVGAVPDPVGRERIARYIEDAATRKRREGTLSDLVVAGAWDEAASWVRDDTIWADSDEGDQR